MSFSFAQGIGDRVRHKHSPTRHGEWTFHLASTTWKSLAKLASMKFGWNTFGEYDIKVTRQIWIFNYEFISHTNVINIVYICKHRWISKQIYNNVIIYSSVQHKPLTNRQFYAKMARSLLSRIRIGFFLSFFHFIFFIFFYS